jgi:hypothetical protein
MAQDANADHEVQRRFNFACQVGLGHPFSNGSEKVRSSAEALAPIASTARSCCNSFPNKDIYD